MPLLCYISLSAFCSIYGPGILIKIILKYKLTGSEFGYIYVPGILGPDILIIS